MRKVLFGVSAATFALLYGLLALVLLVVFHLTNVPLIAAVVITLAVMIIQFLISPFLTDMTQQWFYHTRFDAEMPDYLRTFIEEVCREQKMKYPRMGYIDDGAPNAFTYGHTKNNARIVLTRGIFELLSEDEVKAVVAHELGHAVHYDMLLMTMVELVPTVMYGIYRGLTDNLRFSGGSGDNDDKAKSAAVQAAVAAAAYILYILTQYIVLWFSRTREYAADAFSVDATRDPEALARALIQIGFGLSTRADASDRKAKDQKKKPISVTSANTLGIFDTKASKSLVISCFENGEINKTHIKNAMKWELWNPWARWYELNSTHPLISRRLQAIDSLAPQYGREPFVVFDLEKPESYADDFLRELLIGSLPGLAVLGGLILAGLFYLKDGSPQRMWIPALCLFAASVFSILKYRFSHPVRSYTEANTAGLLGEPKVSGVRSIPCEMEGTVIGRGDPGCVFSEDYVIQDESGIMFLDYNQPLFILNKIFAIFKARKNLDRHAKIRGWYRRSPVPYIELYTMEVEGRVHKCFTYGFGWAWRIAALIVTAVGCAALYVMRTRL